MEKVMSKVVSVDVEKSSDEDPKPRIFTRYLRDVNTWAPIACAVAIVDEDNFIDIGWSACHKKDHFNKKLGRQIALGRAKAGKCSSAFPPNNQDEGSKVGEFVLSFSDQMEELLGNSAVVHVRKSSRRVE